MTSNVPSPATDQITRTLSSVGEFLHGVAYHTTFTNGQRMFADIMRTRPIGVPELLGRSLTGLALAIAATTAETRRR